MTGIAMSVLHVHAAAIHQHWLQPASAYQPQGGPAVYWLLIPEYNDRALIQTHSGSSPTYDSKTGTINFYFADPTYIHTGGTLHKLPKGLAFWQSDTPQTHKARHNAPQKQQAIFDANAHIVRHHPHGQPFAEGKQAPHPYLSITTGTQWNPSKADPVAPNTHILTQTPQQLTRQGKGILTVVTSNVLAQAPYTRHTQNVAQMPLAVRKHHFQVAKVNPYIFYGADIICLQEWDQQLAKGITGYGYIGQMQNGMTSAILYDKNAWNKIDETRIPFTNKPQDCHIATLTHIASGVSITIASCHLPSRPQETQALNDVRAIYKTAQQHAQQYNSYIICAGDFNYNTYTGSITQYPARGNTKSYHNLQQALQPLYDTAAQSGVDYLPTAYDNGFTRMDYIWAQPSLQVMQYKTFPHKDLKQLIKHTAAPRMPAYGYHFSDHAALRATLQVPQSQRSP